MYSSLVFLKMQRNTLVIYIHNLIGNPELEFLHDKATFENLHQDIYSSLFELAILMLKNESLNKYKTNRNGTLLGFSTKFKNKSKEIARNILLNYAKWYYPNLTRYALELRALAYKGGITDTIYNHSYNEIANAINKSYMDNFEKYNYKHENKSPKTAPKKESKALKNAFILGGYTFKYTKQAYRKEIRPIVNYIVDTSFNKDPMHRFVFFRYATGLPLTSESSAVYNYFSKKGYSSNKAIDIKIKELKDEFRNQLKKDYFDYLDIDYAYIAENTYDSEINNNMIINFNFSFSEIKTKTLSSMIVKERPVLE